MPSSTHSAIWIAGRKTESSTRGSTKLAKSWTGWSTRYRRRTSGSSGSRDNWNPAADPEGGDDAGNGFRRRDDGDPQTRRRICGRSARSGRSDEHGDIEPGASGRPRSRWGRGCTGCPPVDDRRGQVHLSFAVLGRLQVRPAASGAGALRVRCSRQSGSGICQKKAAGSAWSESGWRDRPRDTDGGGEKSVADDLQIPGHAVAILCRRQELRALWNDLVPPHARNDGGGGKDCMTMTIPENSQGG